MPLIKRIDGQERVYQDNQVLSRMKWAKLCGVTEHAIKRAIEISGAVSDRVSINGTPTLLTPIAEFPKVMDGLEKRRDLIYGRLVVDRTVGISVRTPLNSHLVFQPGA